MRWRFRTSKQGLKVVRSACKQLGWTRDTVANDQSLIKASKILEPDQIWPQEGFHGRLYADGINEASWRRFLIGKDALSAHIFVAYCLALNVTWEAVVDWSEVDSPIPFVTLPKTIPLPASETNPTSDQSLTDVSEFIRDVTIPDGTIMQPGEAFTKVWEIRNAGEVAWENRYLKRLGASHGPALITSPERVKIPHTLPGNRVEIAVNLKAPDVATTTTAIWKMTDSEGKLCYPDRYRYGLSVVIQVLQ